MIGIASNDKNISKVADGALYQAAEQIDFKVRETGTEQIDSGMAGMDTERTDSGSSDIEEDWDGWWGLVHRNLFYSVNNKILHNIVDY